MGALSGAVGTYAANGPEIEEAVLRRLGLGREDVSTQVVPSDRHAELLEAIALAGAGLERFATEIRHLQRTEVREVEEPFRAGAQKGSSAMPHKRNPIVSERIAGIARLLRGYAQAGLENVALWHERDISHSSVERVALPDATILLDYAQHLAIRVVDGMTVHPERMLANLEATHGALYSQRALLALVEAGRSRDEAYRTVQEAAQRAWDEGIAVPRADRRRRPRARSGRGLRHGRLHSPRPDDRPASGPDLVAPVRTSSPVRRPRGATARTARSRGSVWSRAAVTVGWLGRVGVLHAADVPVEQAAVVLDQVGPEDEDGDRRHDRELTSSASSHTKAGTNASV